MNWQRRAEAQSLPAPFQLPEKIWQILAGRGITTTPEIENHISPKLRDLAHPFSLLDMQPAVDRLIRAYRDKEKILIYGDYDLDGTPGIALLKDGLEKLGFQDVGVFQPSRLRDGYGFHAARMAEFKERGVQLIVTVDVGITDVEAVDRASALGIDVIITDHHLPKEVLPKAVAIVNPNRGDCGSQLQHLCGTGVAFYIVLALRMEMQKQNLLQKDFNPKELLDLFAIATITDMVPMHKENRVLVKHGLHQLALTTRPGLKRLFQELGFYNKKLSSTDVAFRIAPKLNALTRLDEDLRALDVFLVNAAEADKMVSQVLIVNEKRVLLQERAKKIAEELVRSQKVSNYIWIHSHDFHPGVISLVASDLMNTHGVPAFVGAAHGEGRIVGSARAPAGEYNLQEILGVAQSALTKFGGHKMAAGFEIEEQNSNQMRELLDQYFYDKKAALQNDGSLGGAAAATATASVVYDTEVAISDLTPEFMDWYEQLGPFGVGFAPPKLMLQNVLVKSVKVLKGKYLKYTLSQGALTFEAPWFSGAVQFAEGTRVDVLFEPQWNEFAGRRSIQGLISGMRPR